MNLCASEFQYVLLREVRRKESHHRLAEVHPVRRLRQQRSQVDYEKERERAEQQLALAFTFSLFNS